MPPLGSELKAAREAKGMRLEEIAAATRINRRFLAALEEDDFVAFRSDFFARSVIRAYAKSVGLDEKEILARYEPRARRAQSRAPDEEAARRRPHAKPLPSPLKNAVFFIFSATAIGLTLFVFLKNRDEKPLSLIHISEPTRPY